MNLSCVQSVKKEYNDDNTCFQAKTNNTFSAADIQIQHAKV